MYSFTNGVSRDTIGDFVQSEDYVGRMDLNQRIFKAREDAKMTQAQLAEAVGKTRGAVAQWESGEVRPRHQTLVDIAKATKKPLIWLLHGGEVDAEITAPLAAGLPVIGEVAAGMWRESALIYERHYEPVAAHPDYPPHGQRLYRVSGNSINRIAASGEYLHAVAVDEAGVQPENGDLVIVRRLHHGLAEYTAKTMVWEDGRWLLRPESNDPDWQTDIELNGDEDTEIKVTDIVVAKWSPIERRRKVSR
ncbi:helix-turn-helix domain-containing protein [Sinorhizobium meliloti]|uniref:LexA family transcriptional regulator n=1 Tax=Rhizobium meliloti TaxID=382 RepID=UPI000FD8922E|nr:LexA family transcriptional regulator [Sinorhizobium meliloti]RVG08568.1 helix-turn-helix domain-containing protein [Sinorhizobium meliloti]